jgi:DNA (cytosine-5)-methyltransferase 1
MRELSLFTGAGGGVLGTKLLGWKSIGYVEFNEYCQRVIAQRIKDGIFDDAPIFGDIRSFISEGYADSYQGLVDVITAGFPCQPFSVAGKRAASDDPRNMWPQTMEVIRRVQPQFCFLENVPGLLSATVDDESGRSVQYFGAILRDLSEGGFDARWCVVSAADVGAPHLRKRLWVVCSNTRCAREGKQAEGRFSFESSEMGERLQKRRNEQISHTPCERLGEAGQSVRRSTERASRADHEFPNARSVQLQIGKSNREIKTQEARTPQGQVTTRNSWWDSEPDVGRVAHGVANRSHRLTAIGNGQVPAVVATAWRLLTDAP